MAEIDIVSKHLIQTYPSDFARFALQRDDIENVEVIESELSCGTGDLEWVGV